MSIDMDLINILYLPSWPLKAVPDLPLAIEYLIPLQLN